MGGEFVSRQASGRSYRSQVAGCSERYWEPLDTVIRQIEGRHGRKPARGKRRHALFARLRAASRHSKLPSEVTLLLKAYDARQRRLRDQRARRPAQRPRDLAEPRRGTTTTDRALDRCADGGEFEISPEFALETIEYDDFGPVREAYVRSMHRPEPPDWPNLSLPLAVLEDHSLIDIRVLQRRGLFRRGRVTAFAMCWGGDPRDFPIGSAYLAIDLRPDTAPHLKVDLVVASGVSSLQFIGLMAPQSFDRGRWLFRDPVRRSGCEVLALRNGVFARRQSQRLVHASQMPGRGRK
jgi:hypothetical protein